MINLATKACVCGVVGVLASTVALTVPAYAQLTTFAQFLSIDPDPFFQFTNNGANSTFGLFGNPTNGGLSETSFAFATPNGYFPGTNRFQFGQSTSAQTSLTAGVSGPATFNGSTISQGLQNIVVRFTANNPVNGLTNLLSVNFANGVLSGKPSGGAGGVSVSLSNPVGVNAYQSDFLDFTNTANRTYVSEQFAISLSAVNNRSGGIGLTLNQDGYVDSFSANGTGTFSSNPVPPSGHTPQNVPEPITAGLLLTGLLFGWPNMRSKNK